MKKFIKNGKKETETKTQRILKQKFEQLPSLNTQQRAKEKFQLN